MKTKEMEAVRKLRINYKLISNAVDCIEIANQSCISKVKGRENIAELMELEEKVKEYLKTIKKSAREIFRTFVYSGQKE